MGPLVALGWRRCSNQRATIPTEGIVGADPQPQSEGKVVPGGNENETHTPSKSAESVSVYHIHIYIYICIHMRIYIYTHIDISIYRERERVMICNTWILLDIMRQSIIILVALLFLAACQRSQAHRGPDNGTGPECGVRGSEKFQLSSSEMVHNFIIHDSSML